VEIGKQAFGDGERTAGRSSILLLERPALFDQQRNADRALFR
jgi:hypothetical protein